MTGIDRRMVFLQGELTPHLRLPIRVSSVSCWGQNPGDILSIWVRLIPRYGGSGGCAGRGFGCRIS